MSGSTLLRAAYGGILFLLLPDFACGPSVGHPAHPATVQPAEVQPAAVAPQSTDTSHAADASLDQPHETPPEQPLPELMLGEYGGVACGYTSETWEAVSARSAYIRASPGGPRFARVSDGTVFGLALPYINDTSTAVAVPFGAVLTVSHRDSRVIGWTDTPTPLYPAHPIQLGDAAAAAMGWVVSILSTSPGQVTLRAEDQRHVRWLIPQEATVDCDALGLEGASFRSDDALRPPVRRLRSAVLSSTREVPLRSDPQGPIVAMLRDVGTYRPPQRSALPPHGFFVTVLEARSRFVRIGFNSGNLWVFGWVPAEVVVEASPVDGIAGYGSGQGDPQPWRAPMAFPLIVEVEGQRHEVGEVSPSDDVRVIGQGPTYLLDWLRPTEGAAFVLPPEILRAYLSRGSH